MRYSVDGINLLMVHLDERINSLTAEIAALKSELVRYGTEISRLKGENTGLRERVSQLEVAYKSAIEYIKAISPEVVAARYEEAEAIEHDRMRDETEAPAAAPNIFAVRRQLQAFHVGGADPAPVGPPVVFNR
ncbi:MAG: hypothetical protein P1U63_12725 [Coxiellaceae bacterium]|nr:hypothetical protein [Coxiellaceae bacterium]